MPNETIKIGLYKPIYGERALLPYGDDYSLQEVDGNTVICVEKNEADGLDAGMTLSFRRYADRGDMVKTVSGYLTVLNVERIYENGAYAYDKITFDGKPVPLRLYPIEAIYREKIDDEWINVTRKLTDDEITTGIADGSLTTIQDPYYEFDEDGVSGTVVRFTNDHNIFIQDINSNNSPKIIAYDSNGDKIGTYNVRILKNEGYSLANCSDTEERTLVENCDDEEKYEYTHTYLPNDFVTNAILLVNANKDTISKASYFASTENPFYSHGKLYGQGCSNGLEDKDAFNEQYVFVNRDFGYWNVPIIIDSDADNNSLGLSDVQEESLVDDVINQNIPEIIDMERFKYAPVIGLGSSASVVTGITINMHFRKRAPLNGIGTITDADIHQNCDDNGNLDFDEGWRLYTDNDYDSERGKNSNVGWYSQDNNKSDLLGYLGFTDTDIYYQKSKIGKSFIRLSYYDSPDPLNQSLLNYSTVFFDSGEIYGKYLKLKRSIEEGDLTWGYAVGLCDKHVSLRVDSQLVIKNEYNRAKSSEGFNIYLFADDATTGVDEKGEKTIYMKVEFNHAGNGKTIPLTLSGPTDVTVENYLKSLYIPIKIGYNSTRKMYYYRYAPETGGGYIKSSENNDSITLSLYEPRLKKGD